MNLKLAAKLSVLWTAVMVSTVAPAHEFSAGDIKIDHPWARVTPALATVASAYLTIRNSGSEPDKLVGGTTSIAERIEIHQMSIDGGIARMRPLPEGVEIGPGTTVKLAPGDIHLMLIKPVRQLIEGERFKATLQFARAGSVVVEFVIQQNASNATSNGHGGSMP